MLHHECVSKPLGTGLNMRVDPFLCSWSGGRQRSPQLIAEDERLMDGLQKRTLAGKPIQTVRLTQDSPERVRFKA
jgi:hypothetical protein